MAKDLSRAAVPDARSRASVARARQPYAAVLLHWRNRRLHASVRPQKGIHRRPQNHPHPPRQAHHYPCCDRDPYPRPHPPSRGLPPRLPPPSHPQNRFRNQASHRAQRADVPARSWTVLSMCPSMEGESNRNLA
eukprot:scaffold322141_cov30-Tisochrysis_lutea.AAC.3